MLPTFLTKLYPSEAFETVAQVNKNLKSTEFDGAFYKKFKLFVDRFLHFSAKLRILVGKLLH